MKLVNQVQDLIDFKIKNQFLNPTIQKEDLKH